MSYLLKQTKGPFIARAILILYVLVMIAVVVVSSFRRSHSLNLDMAKMQYLRYETQQEHEQTQLQQQYAETHSQ